MLQRDLEKARENLRQELVIAGSQKTHLENRLQEEVCCLHCLYCLRYQRSNQWKDRQYNSQKDKQ